MSATSFKRNTIYNAGATLLPLFVSLFTTPYFLGVLGSARFGIIALVWLLFNYFGIFDLGLSQATSNRLSKLPIDAVERQSQIVWTALAINTLLGAVGGCIYYLAAEPIFSRMSSIPVDISVELSACIIWIACLIPISTVNAVFAGVLESRERFGELNAWQVAGGIAGQLAPLIAIQSFGPTLNVALGATVCSRLVFMLPVAWLALTQIGWKVFLPSRVIVLDLFSYGGWITATNLVNPVLVSADQFLIGSILGVAAVPLYSIPFTLVSKVLIVPGALVRALFPRLSRSTAEGAALQAATALGVIGWGLALVCVPAMFLIEAFLHLWLGESFSEQAGAVSRVLLLGVWMNGTAQVPYTLLQSQGRPDLPAKLHWAEVVPFIALLWVCISQFGLIGAAIAWTARVGFDAGSLIWAAGFRIVAVRCFLRPLVVVVVTLVVSLIVKTDFKWSLYMAAFATFVVAALSYFGDPQMRRAVTTVTARKGRSRKRW